MLIAKSYFSAEKVIHRLSTGYPQSPLRQCENPVTIFSAYIQYENSNDFRMSLKKLSTGYP